MKKEEIKRFLIEYDKYLSDCSELHDIGIDLFEGKYPVFEFGSICFDLIVNENYSPYGVDWINWFVYETNLGRKQMDAFDETQNLICQTLDELLEYIEKYKI